MVKQVKPLERKEEEKKERVEYKPVVNRKMTGNEKLITWFVISCVCCIIGLVIGMNLSSSPEWIGWFALIGFCVPTGIFICIEESR